ncbi:MAG: metallophosphoesterase family protein [Bacteroidia bacterium]|nr:metallophosphoesterase [Nitrosopumilus sp.]
MFRLKIFLLFLVAFINFSCSRQITAEKEASIVVEATEISFAVVGDFGVAGEPARKVADMIKGWNPEFIISVGDNSYTDQTGIGMNENVGQYYCDFIYNPDASEIYRCNGRATREKKNRFFPVTGNHDYEGNDPAVYLDYFTLPGAELYYDFVWGSVHFFAINSGPSGKTYNENSEMAQWLKNKLDKSEMPWKIVYFHHAPFSVGNHGNHVNMQWNFEEWGASMVIAGHDHLYSRISKKPNENFYYFINGLGGHPSRYSCKSNILDPQIFNFTCYNEDFGAMRINADSTRMQIGFFNITDTTPVDTLTLFK